MKIIILLLFFAVILLSIPSVHAWTFGDFLTGDTFVYDVCDYTTLDPYTAVSSKCYELSLVVLDKVEIDGGHVQLIHVTFDGIKDIILVDDSLKIKSVYHKYISTSLSNTIFWINHHAKIQSFEPVIGNVITSIPSKYSNVDVIVSDFVEFDSHTEYMLSFFTTGENQVWIRDDIPLPIKAAVFSKSYVGNDVPFAFTFSLIDSNRPKMYDVAANNITSKENSPDIISDVAPLHTEENGEAPHIDDLDDVVLDDVVLDDVVLDDVVLDDIVLDDIVLDDILIIENQSISNFTESFTIPSPENVLIPETTIFESEIITHDIQVQSIKVDEFSEDSKEKSEESFLDMFFSFFSPLIGIK